MNATFDQGLERIPDEFRNYCWELALKAEGKEWETFKSMVMQMRFGGVSSEAEARRLFWAEQINHKVFFNKSELPSQMAAQLSEDIQSSFQHVSRPITAEHEEDRQLIEILNYYFPSEMSLSNFDECLQGSYDQQSAQTTFSSSASTSSNATFEDDFQLEDTKATFRESVKSSPVEHSQNISSKQTLTNPFTEKKKESNPSSTSERPKVLQYLEAKNKKQNYSELSGKIKEIIDEFYSI